MAESTFKSLLEDNRLWFGENGDNRPRQKKFLRESEGQRPWTWWDNKFASYNQASNKELMKLFDGKLVFDNPKPVKLISRIIELAIGKDGNDIVLDFFSGSATTAHAVMEMNSKDGGNRRYICIQIPQELKDSGNNFKANNVALDLGYKNLCDIGEERILRAGQKIKGETQAEIDYGFRVFRVDSTNMEDVYYRPAEYNHGQMNLFASNIKADRTSEDLLFQVLLDLGILLSSDIEQTEIAGKKVFSVAGGYLIACFDDDVIEETVIEIAKRHPFYAVFRDSGMKTDSVMTNFEQIFETYSPKTQRKVL
jgi:DNA methylase N-4/N-6 domain protein